MKRSFEEVNEDGIVAGDESVGKIFDQIKRALELYFSSLIKIFARNN